MNPDPAHLYRIMLDQSRDATFVLEPKTSRILEVSRVACEIWGYSRDEMIGMKVLDLNPSYKNIDDWYLRLQIIKDGRTSMFETTHLTKNGKILPLEISHRYVQTEDQDLVIAVARDISRRKGYEYELLLLKSAIEQAAESVLITDREGRIEYVNPALERTSGYALAECQGRTPRIFKSGQQDDSFYDNLWTTITRGEVWHGKLNNKSKNGHYYTEECTISPVFDEQRRIHHYIAVRRDVTKEEALEQQLRQAQKMDAVGQLASGIAHDFNNMLGIIIGYSELALRQSSEESPHRQSFTKILDAANRSADLTRQLLTFSRRQIINPRVLDLNRTVDSLLNMLERLLGEEIQLTWRPGADLWPVKMDSSQVDQALVNLCVNAKQAIAGTGEIVIQTENIKIDSAYCEQFRYAVPGSYVLLSIHDNGSGIDPAHLDKIFEPFFTTKGEGEGTGLGLAMVYGIVKQNQGFINVYSEVGLGTTFKLYLPRVLEDEESPPDCSSTDLGSGRGETVLLVEDAPELLQLTQNMLTDLGYRVLPAATIEAALTEARTQHIDLLLTDVVMPEMNGVELSKQIVAVQPQLRILFMSGYSANAIDKNGILNEGVNFLQKPFNRRQLAEKLDEVLR